MTDEFEVEELRAQVRLERRIARNEQLDNRDPEREYGDEDEEYQQIAEVIFKN